jgi:transcriptional regulator
MYIPEYFREQDVGLLHDFMERYNFATLITQLSGEIIASHIPFVLDRALGPYGALRGHIAKKNQQLEQLHPATEALVIFQGPHSYISPLWYANQRTVPTWNYAVVHAYGTPRTLDRAELVDLLHRLVGQHEAPAPEGWGFEAQQPWIAPMLPQIEGFEIPISRLEGKFKLNQNRSAADREGVIETLSRSEDSVERAIADLMRARSADRH